MPKIKATGRDMLMNTLGKYGEDKVAEFYRRADQSKKDKDKALIGIRWVDMEMDEENNSLQIAAKILFPQDSKRLKRLGKEMAVTGFTKVYKVFFSILSVPFLFKQTASRWSQLYDTGKAAIEDIQEHKSSMVVRGFPELPAYMRHYLTGFYEGMMELNGARNPSVILNENNPDAWCWKVKWD